MLCSIALVAVASAGVTAQSPGPTNQAASGSGPAITVVARDQYFSGLPTSLAVGSRLRLSNVGADVHQMIVARRVDGVTQTWDELLAHPDPVGAGLVELTGELFAAPGQTADWDIAIVEPGDYFAVCFVPQGVTVIPDPGATPDPAAAIAPAHYLLGMRQEFTAAAAAFTPGPLPTPTPAAPSNAP